MLTVVLLVMLGASVAAPFLGLGVDTSDARSEDARPAEGWFPATPTA